MTAQAPSLIAQSVARYRAEHQLLDHPRLLEDPLAIAMAGGESNLGSGAGPWMRALTVARCRYAEDQLAAAIGRGATQYVIVGAGLDTYAYRNPNSGVRIFEVDYPATQAWKRNRLDAAGIQLPPSLTFVPTDFEEETLGSALERSGFQPAEISFFSWLGVSAYLSAEAALAAVAFMGSMPAASGVVFDYAVDRSTLDPVGQLAMDGLTSRVALADQPVRLSIDPGALAQMLGCAGFQEIEDLGSDDIDARYFLSRTDGLTVSPGVAHLVSARV